MNAKGHTAAHAGGDLGRAFETDAGGSSASGEDLDRKGDTLAAANT